MTVLSADFAEHKLQLRVIKVAMVWECCLINPESFTESLLETLLMQEHEAALRYFQRATQLDPSFAYAYTLSGHEYYACEDFEQARKLYETALSVDRRHYNAWCAPILGLG